MNSDYFRLQVRSLMDRIKIIASSKSHEVICCQNHQDRRNSLQQNSHSQGWRNDSRGGGTRPWGPQEKGPQVSHRAQSRLYNYCNCWKTVQESKKGPFSLHIGSPWSHPGNGIYWARRGRSLPVPPGFSGHGHSDRAKTSRGQRL